MAPDARPADLPPLEPGDYHELRVHGVAGSSPESMLGLHAHLADVDVERAESDCATEPEPEDISVWCPPRVDGDLRAWSWGSLTSGRWYQAFYLLLLPFMIANMAGWMLVAQRVAPPDDGRPEPGPATAEYRDATVRVSAFLVRVVALLVTVVFVVSFQLVVADLVFWQWLYRDHHAPLWTVGLGTVATAGLLLLTAVLTRIRQRPQVQERKPWDDHRDPVGLGFLAHRQDLLWNSPGINVALRRLHLSAGLATIALLAAWPAGRVDGGWAAVRWLAFGLAVAAAALTVALLARISLGDGTTGMSRVLAVVRHGTWPLAAAAVVLAALFPIGLSAATAQSWVTLPALRGAGVWVAAAVLVGVVLLAVVGFRAAPGRRAVNAPSVLLLAVSVGAAAGAGLAGQTAQLIGGDCGPDRTCLVVGEHVQWIAVGVTTSLALLVAATAGRWLLLARRHGWREALHHLTGHGSWVTALLGAAGAVLAATGVVIALVEPGVSAPDRFPPLLAGLVVLLIVGPPVAGAVVLAWTVPRAAQRRRTAATPGAPDVADPKTWAYRVVGLLAVLLAGMLAGLAVVHDWTVPVLGIPLPPRTFTEFSLDVAVLLPTAALLTRIYSGLTNRRVRRGVGVLWDVGTFWPRWFHPLAPPTYSDRAVPQLVAQLDADLDRAEHRMLLAPHSQGAVIAAAAVLAGPHRPRLAMLSYGSPWGHIYAEFFPAQVNRAATDAVAARLRTGTGGEPRWRNLHRVTDPIGGPIHGVADREPLPDPCHRGHSDYWAEPAYGESIDVLRSALDGAPAVPAPRVTPVALHRQTI